MKSTIKKPPDISPILRKWLDSIKNYRNQESHEHLKHSKDRSTTPLIDLGKIDRKVDKHENLFSDQLAVYAAIGCMTM